MPDKNEKALRKEILHSQREEKRRSIREGLRIPTAKMKELFDFIDKRLEPSECDDTLRHAIEFTRANGLPEERVRAWLEAAGGYCDCEAIGNAENLVEDAVPGYRDLSPPDTVRG
jgi:hypothetical protein